MSIREFILTGIVAILLATFIQNAHADYTPPLQYRIILNAGGAYVSDKTAVCEGAKTYLSNTYSASNPYTTIYNCSELTGSATGNTTSSSYPIYVIYNRTTGTTLSSNTTAGSGIQDCAPNTRKSGLAPNVICNGTAPEPPPSCESGCTGACGQNYKLYTGASYPPIYCISGCYYKMLDGIQGTDPSSWIVLVGNNQGTICTPPAPPPTEPPSPCPICDCKNSGQSYGTVNGAIVCVPKTSTGAAPTAEVKEQPKTTTTPAPTPENPNPTPVESQAPPVVVVTTPPPAGSPAGTEPSVSSSSTNPDGSQTDKTESKESFCKDNPTSKLCKAETQCQENPEGPTCKHFCDKFPDSVACKNSEDFIEQLVGNPDDIPDENIGEKEVNIGEDFNFNPVNIQSNASCPAPRTMTIAGSPMVVSFDLLCEYASAFSLLVKAWATFIAYGIVAAAIRGDAQPHQRSLF